MEKRSHATLTEIYAHAASELATLLAEVAEGNASAAEFDEARAALEALPLNVEEAAIARNRLSNARNYAEAGERGAACYELRLLARSLAP
jgi:hypothetical protein